MFSGVLHTIGSGQGGHLGLYRLETQTTAGSGKFAASGLGSSSAAREALKVSFDFFKANVSRISGSTKANEHDYHVHLVELQNSGPTTSITLAGFIAACSGILQKPLQGQMVVLGDMSLGGSIKPVENLASGTIWNFVLEAFWLLYDFEPFSEQNSELGLCLGPFAC